jgi:hypothetical protein
MAGSFIEFLELSQYPWRYLVLVSDATAQQAVRLEHHRGVQYHTPPRTPKITQQNFPL